MNKHKRGTTTICGWVLAVLLSAGLLGCGGSGDDNNNGGGNGGNGSVAAGATAVPGAAGTAGASGSDPTVASASPANNATNISTSSNSAGNVVTGTLVTANFSQAMDATTINSSPAGTLLTFTLKKTLTGVNEPGTVAMNVARTAAVFTPTASALAANTSYTATVSMAAKSAGGTAMASPIVWSFTTAATLSTGQAPINLGLAGNYAIFADTGIATVPASVITGDIGVGPGVTSSAITGFALTLPAGSAFSTSAQVSGKVYAFDYAPPTPANVNTAANDMATAYTDAAGRTAGVGPFLNVGAGTLTGLTLAPGVYTWGSNVTIPTNLTLSGTANDVWIFQISGTLDLAASKQIILVGAKAKNVFWQTSGAVTVGANAHFEGVVLGQTAINFGNQASANSRLLAQTAVNLNQNAITPPAQ
ncbi:hypothetical protein GCM10027046_08530 [Uliginosibacterium flavum]|uniref:Ice-binding family protein n=1 Tax=Uliginosibacterium flavum TaxID=1396831 RepID=A0ABV2TK92_9RHOO